MLSQAAPIFFETVANPYVTVLGDKKTRKAIEFYNISWAWRGSLRE